MQIASISFSRAARSYTSNDSAYPVAQSPTVVGPFVGYVCRRTEKRIDVDFDAPGTETPDTNGVFLVLNYRDNPGQTFLDDNDGFIMRVGDTVVIAATGATMLTGQQAIVNRIRPYAPGFQIDLLSGTNAVNV